MVLKKRMNESKAISLLLRFMIIISNAFILFREVMLISMGLFWFVISLAGEGAPGTGGMLSFFTTVAVVFICGAAYSCISIFLVIAAIANKYSRWSLFLSFLQLLVYFMVINTEYLSMIVEELITSVSISFFSVLALFLYKRFFITSR